MTLGAPTLARGAARVAGLAWLVAAFSLALRNGSHPTTRDIGQGVVADCGRVFASQLPQLALGLAGGGLLIVAAARDAVRPSTFLIAAALLAAWVASAALLPGAFAWDCGN